MIGDAVRTDLAGARMMGFDSLFIAGGIHRDETMHEGAVDAAGAREGAGRAAGEAGGRDGGAGVRRGKKPAPWGSGRDRRIAPPSTERRQHAYSMIWTMRRVRGSTRTVRLLTTV